MSRFHSVRLNRDLCVGCTNCIKKCPTEAIRVRDGKAKISDGRCIDCGECIKVCPHHAKSASMDPLERMNEFDCTIALAAPSLYAQFGAPADRFMVLAALKNLGFNDVYEVAIGADIVTEHTIQMMKQLGKSVPKPLISSACPAVVRLIQMRFPGLIDNLVPFDSPMEVIAEIARAETILKTGLKSDRIGIFFISPCPAKRTATAIPYGRERSHVDAVVAISDAYPLILSKLEKMDLETVKDFKQHLLARATGIRWGYTGGEAQSLNNEKYLAVDGIHNVISILEEVENERLRDIDFIEANSCLGGCIGGPLTVANRFSGTSRQRSYVRAASQLAFDKPKSFFNVNEVILSEWDKSIEPNKALNLDDDIEQALVKYAQMEDIVKRLPGLDCGACGAPDCASLAEDIVRGEATETDCIFKLKERIRNVAAQMFDLEAEMNRHAQSSDKNAVSSPQEVKTEAKGETGTV
jgi:iron only hydrogenase large subunit-like protein